MKFNIDEEIKRISVLYILPDKRYASLLKQMYKNIIDRCYKCEFISCYHKTGNCQVKNIKQDFEDMIQEHSQEVLI